MAEKTPDTVTVTFIDNPHAPEVFADEATGFLHKNGVVAITFASARCDHSTSPGPINRVVIARLLMTVAGAQGLAVGLFDFLKNQGIDPSIPADPKKLQ